MNRNCTYILEVLLQNNNRFLSGAYLSSQLGISRAAVWKHIRTLRQNGYEITAKPNCGYILKGQPDLLQKDLFTDQNIFYYETIDSTNLKCRFLAEDNAAEYSTVIAEKQLQGRGRLGRNWFSPSYSGLWFSMLLRPQKISPEDISAVTLVTSATIAEILNHLYNLPVKVKWPNDLMIGDKKTGGILTEIKAEPDWIEYLVVGVGININQRKTDFPKELAHQATSLAIEGNRDLDRTNLFLELRQELIKAYQTFLNNGFASFRELWRKHNLTLGKKVTVTRHRESFRGYARDLDEKGALLIQDNQNKLHSINYGEIRHEV
ncbi:MAG: biotin--[acetyl-CoA-carboxylase] ligase [Bacillota bacterium]